MQGIFLHLENIFCKNFLDVGFENVATLKIYLLDTSRRWIPMSQH